MWEGGVKNRKARVQAAELRAHIERNQAEPHVSTIRKLSEALDVSPEQLIIGE